MARFPFFREIAGARTLVVGGGEVALRRARALSEFGAEVLAVAPDFCAGFKDAGIKCVQRAFEMSDIDGAVIVVAATDNRGLNAGIGEECRRRGIEVNIADDSSACSFQFPGLVRRGALTVGISTNGASPAAAKFIRERIEEAIPEEFEKALVCMEMARELAGRLIGEPRVRAKVLRKMFVHCLEGGSYPEGQELEELIRHFQCAEMD